MSIVSWLKNAIKSYKNIIIDTIAVNNSIIEDVTLINIRRLFYFCIIGMLVNLTSVIVLRSSLNLDDKNIMEWRDGVIMSHSILFFTFAVLGFCCFLLRKKGKANFAMRVFQNIINGIVLAFGIVITYIDQRITTNITPFLVACTITSVIFLIRPIVAFMLYLGAYLAFHYALGAAQINPTVLLSDRVNGITAIGIGFCISIVMWSINKSNMLQKRVIATQQKELEQNNLKLEDLAFYDSLTGLYSRRKFEELIQNEITDIYNHKHKACLIILDIDFFKEINDNYGHPVGDLVIKQMASLLKKNVRKTDAVARWGGDEFLILLPNTSVSEGYDIAEKLRGIMEKTGFFIKEKEILVTASFGVAGLKDGTNDTLELAYKDADKALYSAKEKGRNRIEMA